MTQAKQYIAILVMMSLSFSLGWAMRGDRIYSEMFKGMTYLAADTKAVK